MSCDAPLSSGPVCTLGSFPHMGISTWIGKRHLLKLRCCHTAQKALRLVSLLYAGCGRSLHVAYHHLLSVRSHVGSEDCIFTV